MYKKKKYRYSATSISQNSREMTFVRLTKVFELSRY